MSCFRVKRITFFQRQVPILCQNENGPCPLLAICNGLLLRGHISLPTGRMEISTDELISIIANRLFEGNASALQSKDLNVQANAQRSVDDVIKILPDFVVGLDVNVKFNKVDGFEFTRQLTTFDLTGLRLLHGWLYDPQDRRSKDAVGTMTYNELITRVITLRSELENKNQKKPQQKEDEEEEDDGPTLEDALRMSKATTEDVVDAEVVEIVGVESKTIAAVIVEGTEGNEGKTSTEGNTSTEGKESIQSPENTENTENTNSDDLQSYQTLAALEDFLNSTQTQLSYHGLAELHSSMKDRELSVFFRNNHFNTLFKYKDHLYLLLTDIGYEHQKEYVWERLTEIDGDTMCCTGLFKRSPTASSLSGSAAPTIHDVNDPDYLLALQLQEEANGGSDGGNGNGNRIGTIVMGQVVSTGGGRGGAAKQSSSTVTNASVVMNNADLLLQEQELKRLKNEHQNRKKEQEQKKRKKGKKGKKGNCVIS